MTAISMKKKRNINSSTKFRKFTFVKSNFGKVLIIDYVTQEKLVSVLLHTFHGVSIVIIGCFTAYFGLLPTFRDGVSVLFLMVETSEVFFPMPPHVPY
jgi:hypothetical protein